MHQECVIFKHHRGVGVDPCAWETINPNSVKEEAHLTSVFYHGILGAGAIDEIFHRVRIHEQCIPEQFIEKYIQQAKVKTKPSPEHTV